VFTETTLTGAGIDITVIDGALMSDDTLVDISTSLPVTLFGMTLKNAELAIDSSSNTLTLDTCKITDNAGALEGGTTQIVDSTISNNNSGDGTLTVCGVIDINGNLEFTRNVFEENIDDGCNSPIFVDGNMTVEESVFRNNSSRFNSAVVWHNVGDLTVLDSEFSNNESIFGSVGAIDSSGGDLVIRRSTITANVVELGGDGAILHNDGTLTITDSTISGNDGSGITSDYSVVVTVANTTISANEDSGIVAEEGTLNNCTIVENGEVGIQSGSTFLLSVANTLLAGNAGGFGNCDGDVLSVGYNVDDSGQCLFASPGDLSSIADVGIAPLV
jgi:hypothetical protein